jgi:CBS domain-containing protein
MHVSEILDLKGSDVLSVRTGSSLRDAARELVTRGIGAVVVCDDGGDMVGILSERDVARHYGTANPGSDCRVDDVMTREVISCTRTHSVEELAEIMSSSNIRHVPVVDGRRVDGMISIRDVVRFRLGELESENATLREIVVALK